MHLHQFVNKTGIPTCQVVKKKKRKTKHRASAAVRALFRERARGIELIRRAVAKAAAKAAAIAATATRYADACLRDVDTMVRYCQAWRKESEKRRVTKQKLQVDTAEPDDNWLDQLYPQIQHCNRIPIEKVLMNQFPQDQYSWENGHAGFQPYDAHMNLRLNMSRHRLEQGHKIMFTRSHGGRLFRYEILRHEKTKVWFQYNIDTQTSRQIKRTDKAEEDPYELPDLFHNDFFKTMDSDPTLVKHLRDDPVAFIQVTGDALDAYRRLFSAYTGTFEVYGRDGYFTAELVKVERVWSAEKSMFYELTKRMLRRKGHAPNERIEWHGSHSHDLHTIARAGGLDPKYSRPGRYFGHAIYTSSKFAYCISRGYCRSNDDLFVIGLVRVLRGRIRIEHAPLNVDIRSAGPDHDSIVAPIDGTTMTASYDRCKVCIHSLVTFKVTKKE